MEEILEMQSFSFFPEREEGGTVKRMYRDNIVTSVTERQ